VVEASGVFKKDFLDAADSQMHQGSVYGGKDLGFDLSCLGIKVGIFNGLGFEVSWLRIEGEP
jgi:hypothetical protein